MTTLFNGVTKNVECFARNLTATKETVYLRPQSDIKIDTSSGKIIIKLTAFVGTNQQYKMGELECVIAYDTNPESIPIPFFTDAFNTSGDEWRKEALKTYPVVEKLPILDNKQIYEMLKQAKQVA